MLNLAVTEPPRTEAAARLAAAEGALLSRIAAGDLHEAVGELYDRYERRLYGFGLRMLGDGGLAEELVQETFIRVWRSAATFDPRRGTVASLVFTIARRIAVDLWRRPSSRPFEPEPSEAASSSDPVDNVVVGLTVRDALESLSSQHREVLELTHFEGLKQREIADRLGIPVGTVKTRTYYALRTLKEALRERGVDDD